LDVYGDLRVGNGNVTERFCIDATGVAHMARETGGYNLTIENTSSETSEDYGAAHFIANNGVNAIKADGRVIFTGDFVLKSPNGTLWNLWIDNTGSLHIQELIVNIKNVTLDNQYSGKFLMVINNVLFVKSGMKA